MSKRGNRQSDRAKAKKLREVRLARSNPTAALSSDECAPFTGPFQHFGYLGKPKGSKQMAWESGWVPPGAGATKMKGCDFLQLLRVRPDFVKEHSTLAKLFIGKGHGFLRTPVCHPEIAGKGIEYAWGKAKYEFRNFINTKSNSVPVLTRSVFRALGREDFLARDGQTRRDAPLPLMRIRRFARKTRMYMRAYGMYLSRQELLAAAKQDNETTFAMIEKQLKVYPQHRTTMDIDFRACTATVMSSQRPSQDVRDSPDTHTTLQ